MKKAVIWGVLLSIAVVLLTAGLLVSTERGLTMLLPFIVRVIPGEIAFKSIEGKLIGPISVKGLMYKTDGTRITADSFTLDWVPSSLLSGEVYLSKFTALNVRVQSKAKGKEPGPPKLPKLNFPLTVTVRDAVIQNLVVENEGKKPIIFHSIFFGGSAGWNALSIRHLKISMPNLSAAVKGKIRTSDDYPLDLATGWQVAPQGYPPVSGSGTISGTLRQITFTQEVKRPFTAAVSGEIENVFGAPSWSADLTIRKAVPAALKPQWPKLMLSGAFHGKGSLDAASLGGTFSVAGTKYGTINGSASLSYREDILKIQTLSLMLAGEKTGVTLVGEVRIKDKEPSFSLQGRWSSLVWPLTGKPAVQSTSGSFSVKGAMNAYALALDFTLAGAQIPSATWSIKGEGTRELFKIHSLNASLLDGTLNGDGMIRWKPQLQWNLALKGRDLNPAMQWKEWPGSLSLDARVAGEVQKGQLNASLDIKTLRGTLREYSLKASLQLTKKGDAYSLSRADIRSGRARITASGSLTEVWNFTWSITAPEIAALYPDLKGSLAANGQVGGERETPRIEATLRGKGTTYKEYRAAGFNAELLIDLEKTQPSRVEMTTTGLQLGKQHIQSLALKGSGTLSDHALQGALKGNGYSATFLLQGGYEAMTWEGQLQRASVSAKKYGTWVLESAAPFLVNLKSKHVRTGKVCMSNPPSILCITLDWNSPTGGIVNATVRTLPLAVLHPFLPPAIGLEGTFNANLDVRQTKESITAQVSLRTSQGAVSYPLGDAQRNATAFRESSLNATLENKVLAASFAMPLVEGGIVKGSFRLPGYTSLVPPKMQQLNGQLIVELQQLGIIPAFLPTVQNTRGVFRADLSLSGTLADLLVTGKVSIEKAEATVPQLGIRLYDVRLSLASDKQGAATITGQLSSGQGRIAINGTATLDPEKGWPLRVTIKGERFEAARLPRARVVASPDITLTMQGRTVTAVGEVFIPEATIEPPEKTKVVPVSPDVVVVNGTKKEEQERKTAWKVSSRIRVRLGDKVRFNGYGVSGRLTGNVLLISQPGKVATATGEIQIVEGVYKAYGQKLDIERGRIVFTGGPVSNPGIDARAIRKVGDVTAGIEIQGTIKNPKTTLFSSPTMDETSILSYLVLGRPVESATSEQGKLLYNAALSLSLSGGEYIAKKLSTLFGIGEVKVEKGETLEEASVVIGRYLAPNLYISYGIGIFEPLNRVRVRYDVTKKIQIQAETGTQSGADVFYKIER